MVWYDEVAEYTSTGGKTVERYDYLYDQSNASGNKAIYWSALIDTPHLIDRKIYKGDRLQEHTIYKYADNNQYIQGILVNTKLCSWVEQVNVGVDIMYIVFRRRHLPIYLNRVCFMKILRALNR